MIPFYKLTDNEKGALLLAAHNGLIIQVSEDGDTWINTENPTWLPYLYYRVYTS